MKIIWLFRGHNLVLLWCFSRYFKLIISLFSGDNLLIFWWRLLCYFVVIISLLCDTTSLHYKVITLIAKLVFEWGNCLESGENETIITEIKNEIVFFSTVATMCFRTFQPWADQNTLKTFQRWDNSQITIQYFTVKWFFVNIQVSWLISGLRHHSWRKVKTKLKTLNPGFLSDQSALIIKHFCFNSSFDPSLPLWTEIHWATWNKHKCSRETTVSH